MKILALIPARMGSSRFPGKPLKKILGKPMIGHVFDNVKKNELLTKVSVATCDQEIADYVDSIGGDFTMTSSSHERASDRCAEALLSIEEETNTRFDIAVMVQGDEPMIHPQMITQAVQPMIEDKNIMITNLMGKIESKDEFQDSNCIKVVCDKNNDALYFSREPIPSLEREKTTEINKQICVIPFRRDYLFEYSSLSPTPLEVAESVDMLRILEHGGKVRMVPTEYKTYAVDTKQDLERVEKIIGEKGKSNN